MRRHILLAMGVGVMLCLALFATTSTPSVTHTSPIIQGYVYNQNRQPVSGVYVRVVDSETAELYGEGVTDTDGYYCITLKRGAVGRYVDISWRKGHHSRQEFGLLIPTEDYVSRVLYTYMTTEVEERVLTVFVYDYPYGYGVPNVTVSVEDARTLTWVAKGVTNERGVVMLKVPANITVNVYANVNSERSDILGGQELGVGTYTNGTVILYVERKW